MKRKTSGAGTLILEILTVLVLFGAVSFGLWGTGLLSFPGIPSGNGDSGKNEYAENSGRIFEDISGADAGETVRVYPEITVEKLGELLRSLRPYKNYCLECHTALYSSAGSAETRVLSRVSGECYNIELFDGNDKLKKSYVCDGRKVKVTNFGTGTESALYDCGLFDFFSDASLVSLDEFKDLPLDEYESTLLSVSEENADLISVSYTYDRGGNTVKNSYLISLDFGLVLEAECTENDVLTYKLTTDSVYPIDTLGDELFRTE